MKTFGIILVTFIAAAIIVGGGTYYMVSTKATKDKNDLQAQTAELAQKVADTQKTLADAQSAMDNSSDADAASDWKSYTNATYGFSLTFPGDAWKNYKVIETTPTDNSAVKYLYFAVPTTDTAWKESGGESGYASPIAVSVYTQAQWASAKDEPQTGSSVGQNTNYVFTISGWQASPTDLANTDFAVKSIISSFKAS
jgi:hypothetical protein